jgi:hypothetical protein
MEVEPGCKTCKGKSNNSGKTKTGVIVFGSYLLFSSVYGTIQLIKYVINYLSN